MSESTEAQVIAQLATEGTEARRIEPGEVYTLANGAGGLVVRDTDAYAPSPRRTAAARRVNDSHSFVQYLEKHGLADQTEVYADVLQSSIIAVLDAHAGADRPAGWQDHKLTLVLEHTKSWKAWTDFDGKWFSQIDFAEFIEQRATDVVDPSAGDLMTLVQKIYMTKGVEFESSERQSDGQTELVYKEKVATKGLGKLELPKDLKLALQPYVGGPRQHAFANFRTRLNGSQMVVGYVLVRPEEILEGIFADIVTEIRDGRAASDVRPAIEAIPYPIYFGRPQ